MLPSAEAMNVSVLAVGTRLTSWIKWVAPSATSLVEETQTTTVGEVNTCPSIGHLGPYNFLRSLAPFLVDILVHVHVSTYVRYRGALLYNRI